MNTTVERADKLEGRFERLVLRQHQIERQVAALENKIQLLQQQGTPFGGGGGGAIGFVDGGVVIAAGGSATADISILVGGSTTTYVAGATIFNKYAAATTAGKTLTVGQFPDGSWIVLAQSC